MTSKRGLEVLITLETKHLSSGSVCPPMGIGALRCYSTIICPYAHRARLILLAKNLKHEIINVSLKSKPEWLIEKNPIGKVPVLEKDGKLVCESLIICDLLEELYPDPPLYPSDKWKKTEDRFLIERWSKTSSAWFTLLMAAGESDKVSKSLSNMHEGLTVFEHELKKRGTKFFFGEKPGMIDYMIWPHAERFTISYETAKVDKFFTEDQYPTLVSWSSAMMEDPIVKAAFLPAERYKVYRETGKYDLD